MLAHQLSNVGAPVSNHRLVLQLIAGLNESYDVVATIIQQSDPLPLFYEARSKIILEETRKEKQASIAASAASTALINTSTSENPPRTANPSSGPGSKPSILQQQQHSRWSKEVETADVGEVTLIEAEDEEAITTTGETTSTVMDQDNQTGTRFHHGSAHNSGLLLHLAHTRRAPWLGPTQPTAQPVFSDLDRITLMQLLLSLRTIRSQRILKMLCIT